MSLNALGLSPSVIWTALGGLLLLLLAVVLVWRRMAYLDRRETLFWARRGARDGVENLQKALADAMELASDPHLGPTVDARLAASTARLAGLEGRFDSLPPDLAGEFRELQGSCVLLADAVRAAQRLRQAALSPRDRVIMIEAHIDDEPPAPQAAPGKRLAAARAKKPPAARAPRAAALRTRLDRLEQQRAEVEQLLAADALATDLPQRARELADKYAALGHDAYPLWEACCPMDAAAGKAEAQATLGQLLDFQRRFGEQQERDHAEQRDIERRERARRGDDEQGLLDRLL